MSKERKEKKRIKVGRLQACKAGLILLYAFLISSVIFGIGWTFAYFGWGFSEALADMDWHMWVPETIAIVLIEALMFWLGIILIYAASVQLGFKWRVIGIICGLIPIAHLIVLFKLLHLVSAEIKVENEKYYANLERQEQQVCNTKYPILLVHGVFFRDSKVINYWGRIPGELEKNGATILYGNHQSAASVAEAGAELAKRIEEIVTRTRCEKVNIIAHSKGGLDSRYAISKLGMAPYVASLTTINTPHRGCEFADYLLNLIPEKEKELIAKTYNMTLRKLGDENPDFISAVTDLTASRCMKLNEEVLDVEGVYYQSTGSSLKGASCGRFPLNLTTRFVHLFDGENDGLVGKDSFRWGEKYTYLEAPGKRGISHGDMVDLNRENIKGFDVREFYVNLVSELKKEGF